MLLSLRFVDAIIQVIIFEQALERCVEFDQDKNRRMNFEAEGRHD